MATDYLYAAESHRAVLELAAKAARLPAPVLILGETGVGKELVARRIHEQSARSGRFIALNCSAIPHNLIESELFGHTPGAFTDARSARPGAFSSANKGTLFLDEIGDLSCDAQPKLLRAIELGEVKPVGSDTTTPMDIRIIAATNQDLGVLSQKGTFRPDLYFRLRGMELLIPPLRERREDIPLLAEHFARLIAEEHGIGFTRFTDDAIVTLCAYQWPGNVRELRAVVERAVVCSGREEIDSTCFDYDLAETERSTNSRSWRQAVTAFERAYALQLLRESGGSVYQAAAAAGLNPRSLYKILTRLGIDTDGSSDASKKNVIQRSSPRHPMARE